MVFHVFTLVLCYADEVILILLGFLRLVKKSRLIILSNFKGRLLHRKIQLPRLAAHQAALLLCGLFSTTE